ncbi:hypothetical protein, partial [Xanthomonas graminis]|uniref:hypothetical protein n=1 Tax=Xanthomonas graminis TaxID=3390026 RepID=UPI001C400795
MRLKAPGSVAALQRCGGRVDVRRQQTLYAQLSSAATSGVVNFPNWHASGLKSLAHKASPLRGVGGILVGA